MSNVEYENEQVESADAPDKGDWAELGRVFPWQEEDFDVDLLSPHGHEVVNEDGESEWVKSSHPAIRDKVELPTPRVILQEQSQGDKKIFNADLTEEEWDKIKKAHDEGRLDPDGNGTHRLASQASLSDLGLDRIQNMLGPGRRSGAYEGIV